MSSILFNTRYLTQLPTKYKIFLFAASLVTLDYLLQGKISRLALSCFSPKQSVRPLSLWKDVVYLSPILWKLLLKMRTANPSKETSQEYLNELIALRKLRANQPLSPIEINALKNLFSRTKPPAMPEGLRLRRLHLFYTTLIGFMDTREYKLFMGKLHLIEAALIYKNIKLADHQKLTFSDCLILVNVKESVETLSSLVKLGIQIPLGLIFHWESIQQFCENKPFKDFLALCQNEIKEGQIYLSNRMVSNEFSFQFVAKHLIMGKFAHIGIFVKQPDGSFGLSHINDIHQFHGITPFKPLLAPFHTRFEFDVSSLSTFKYLNPYVNHLFHETFVSSAKTLRPHLKVAKIERQWELWRESHTQKAPQKLLHVDFPPNDCEMTCTHYVGIVFLKAIQRLHQYFSDFENPCHIQHPFGEFENLKAIDILRLIYLWNKIKVIKEVPVSDEIKRVLAI